jgi:hypothetical protein
MMLAPDWKLATKKLLCLLSLSVEYANKTVETIAFHNYSHTKTYAYSLDCGLVGYFAMYFSGCIPLFWQNMLPPS